MGMYSLPVCKLMLADFFFSCLSALVSLDVLLTTNKLAISLTSLLRFSDTMPRSSILLMSFSARLQFVFLLCVCVCVSECVSIVCLCVCVCLCLIVFCVCLSEFVS